MEQVYLSLGSNLGDRLNQLRRAIAMVREFATVTAISQAYESDPVGYTGQPDFLNAVLELSVNGEEPGAPGMLLEKLLAVERSLGRRRDASAIPKGPRQIDLDLLLFGSRIVDDPSLTVPHPAMAERRFVLLPLTEIAPQARHPLLGLTAEEMLRQLPTEGPQVRPFAALDSVPR